MAKKTDQFNIVIVGTGGQGLITLLQVLAEAAILESYDFKTSELHGLSQRAGSVEVHIRFGRKVYSPIVAQGKADLILALEAQEALRSLKFANSKSTFLINKYIIPIPLQKNLTENQILSAIRKISKKINVIPAFDICQKELGIGVTAGIYLVSLAAWQGFLPLRPESILQAIKKVIPQQYLDINQKTFELVKKHEES